MNDKETILHRIVEIVVDCCAMQVDESGKMSVTVEDVLGTSRCENVVMTRCILVRVMYFCGYSLTTAAQLLKRTTPAVRHMMQIAQTFHLSSGAYRTAESEAERRCKELTI